MEAPLEALKALSDPVRLRALEFLRSPVASCCRTSGEVCACDLEKHLNLSQPTVSHHMKVLIQAGLVTTEKRGRWVYYRINTAALHRVTEYLQGLEKMDQSPKGRFVEVDYVASS